MNVKAKKNIIIASSTIVCLGAIYLGSTWFTGYKIEQSFDEKITKLSTRISELYDNVSIHFEYENYQRGLFSTTLHLTAKNQVFFMDQLVYENVMWEGDIAIYHGPFPYSELRTGNFSPKLAGFYYETDAKFNQTLWESADQKPFIMVNSAVGYSGDVSISLKNRAQTYEPENFTISAGKIDLYLNNNLNLDSVKLQLDQLEYENITLNGFRIDVKSLDNKSYQGDIFYKNLILEREDAYYGYTETVEIDDFNYHVMFSANSNALYQDELIKANKISYSDSTTFDEMNASLPESDDTEINVVVHQFEMNSKNNSIVHDQINGETSYKVSNIEYGIHSLGAIDSQFSYQNLPLHLINSSLILPHYSWSPMYILRSFIQPKTDDDVKNDIGTAFNIDKFNWQTESGLIDASANLLLGDIYDLEDLTEDNINLLKLHFAAPMTSLIELNSKLNNHSTLISDSQYESSQQLIDFINNKLDIVMPIIEYQPEDSDKKAAGIYAELYYSVDENTAQINGQSVPKKQFFQRIRINENN